MAKADHPSGDKRFKVLDHRMVVSVDYYLPGCPPPAERIRHLVGEFLEGRTPMLQAHERRFG